AVGPAPKGRLSADGGYAAANGRPSSAAGTADSPTNPLTHGGCITTEPEPASGASQSPSCPGPDCNWNRLQISAAARARGSRRRPDRSKKVKVWLVPSSPGDADGPRPCDSDGEKQGMTECGRGRRARGRDDRSAQASAGDAVRRAHERGHQNSIL